MSRLLADETDRAAALTRFVDDLDPDDEALLTALLARREPGHPDQLAGPQA